MNVLNKVTWSAMWKNRTRTIVTVIGINYLHTQKVLYEMLSFFQRQRITVCPKHLSTQQLRLIHIIYTVKFKQHHILV